MSRGSSRLSDSKIARMSYTQSGNSDKENGTVPKLPRPIMTESDSDVVHGPTVGSKQWMFDPRLSDVVSSHIVFHLTALRILS